MNALRRKQIFVVLKKVEELDDLRLEIADLISDILSDEHDAYDNLPESLQESERGQAMEDAIDNLESAQEEIDELDLQDLIDYLEEAQG